MGATSHRRLGPLDNRDGSDMGILDKAKKGLNDALGKAGDLADKHGDKVTGAIGKAGDLVDKKTKGKYSSKIDAAEAKAKGAVDKLAERGEASDTVEAGTEDIGTVDTGTVDTGTVDTGTDLTEPGPADTEESPPTA
jgi:hypothetical protein